MTQEELVRILLDAGVYEEDDAEPQWAEAVAGEILTRLAETTLQGATQPAPEGVEIASAGEYAAAWNAAAPESRQLHLERIQASAAAAQRCLLQDHGALLELVTYWRRRAEHAEDVLASVQAGIRTGPET